MIPPLRTYQWPRTDQTEYVVVTSRSYHANAVNALLLDGSVRCYSSSTAQSTWRALGTRAGGEVVAE